MIQKSKVAIVGLGNIGTAVATNLVKGKRPFIVADRKIGRAKELAQQLGSLAQPMEIPAAIKEADIILFAIWFDALKRWCIFMLQNFREKSLLTLQILLQRIRKVDSKK